MAHSPQGETKLSYIFVACKIFNVNISLRKLLLDIGKDRVVSPCSEYTPTIPDIDWPAIDLPKQIKSAYATEIKFIRWLID